MGTTLERVSEIVAEQLGVNQEKLTAETRFVEDLGCDSLDAVELTMDLEEEFDINIPDDAIERVVTVGQVVKWIDEKR